MTSSCEGVVVEARRTVEEGILVQELLLVEATEKRGVRGACGKEVKRLGVWLVLDISVSLLGHPQRN